MDLRFENYFLVPSITVNLNSETPLIHHENCLYYCVGDSIAKVPLENPSSITFCNLRSKPVSCKLSKDKSRFVTIAAGGIISIVDMKRFELKLEFNAFGNEFKGAELNSKNTEILINGISSSNNLVVYDVDKKAPKTMLGQTISKGVYYANYLKDNLVVSICLENVVHLNAGTANSYLGNVELSTSCHFYKNITKVDELLNISIDPSVQEKDIYMALQTGANKIGFVKATWKQNRVIENDRLTGYKLVLMEESFKTGIRRIYSITESPNGSKTAICGSEPFIEIYSLPEKASTLEEVCSSLENSRQEIRIVEIVGLELENTEWSKKDRVSAVVWVSEDKLAIPLSTGEIVLYIISQGTVHVLKTFGTENKSFFLLDEKFVVLLDDNGSLRKTSLAENKVAVVVGPNEMLAATKEMIPLSREELLIVKSNSVSLVRLVGKAMETLNSLEWTEEVASDGFSIEKRLMEVVQEKRTDIELLTSVKLNQIVATEVEVGKDGYVLVTAIAKTGSNLNDPFAVFAFSIKDGLLSVLLDIGSNLPTCLTHNSVSQQLAVGTNNGSVFLFGFGDILKALRDNQTKLKFTQEIKPTKPSTVSHIAFTEDGKRLARLQSSLLTLWEVATGSAVRLPVESQITKCIAMKFLGEGLVLVGKEGKLVLRKRFARFVGLKGSKDLNLKIAIHSAEFKKSFIEAIVSNGAFTLIKIEVLN